MVLLRRDADNISCDNRKIAIETIELLLGFDCKHAILNRKEFFCFQTHIISKGCSIDRRGENTLPKDTPMKYE